MRACSRLLPTRPAAPPPPLRPPPLLLLLLLLQPGWSVVLIGYRGAALIEELQAPAADGRLSLAYLPDL